MKSILHGNRQISMSSLNFPDCKSAAGFISGTGILSIFVAVLLLASVAMLASQMWQSNFHSSESSAKHSVSQSDLAKKIQKQKSLQLLTENINLGGVITSDDSTDVVMKQAIHKQQLSSSEIKTATQLTTDADVEPEATVFTGDPAIYNQTINGRVLSNRGQSIADIKLSARLISPLDVPSKNVDSGNTQQKYKAVSNSQGMFQFNQLPKGQFQLSIEATKKHGAANLQVNSGSNHVDLTVNEMRQVLVKVKVSDEFDYPLEKVNATVEPGLASDISDVDGWLNFQLDLEEERHYRIRFGAQGYADDTLVLLPDVLRDSSKDVVQFEKTLKQRLMHSDADLAGTIMGKDGTSVADARIVIKTPAGVTKFSGITDSRGVYAFYDMPVNETYRMYISPKREFASLTVELKDLIVGPQNRDIRLHRLEENASLSGHIVDSSGSPLPDYQFDVYSKVSGRVLPVKSDSQGQFHVTQLPAGEVSLRSNTQPRVGLHNIELKAGELTRVTLPVDLGSEDITGKVVDSSGRPVPGASVTLLWGAPVGELSAKAKTRHLTRTDSQGIFRFANLGQGKRYMSVTARGYLTSNATILIPGNDEILKIKLDRRKT